MSAVQIDCAPGAFLDALAPDTRARAIDWPPPARPLQIYAVGPVLEAFLAAQREGRRLELRQISGHPVVVETHEVDESDFVPGFLRIAGGGR